MITKPIAEKAQLKLFINPREISLFPNLLFLINRKKNHATFLIAKVKKSDYYSPDLLFSISQNCKEVSHDNNKYEYSLRTISKVILSFYCPPITLFFILYNIWIGIWTSVFIIYLIAFVISPQIKLD